MGCLQEIWPKQLFLKYYTAKNRFSLYKRVGIVFNIPNTATRLLVEGSQTYTSQCWLGQTEKTLIFSKTKWESKKKSNPAIDTIIKPHAEGALPLFQGDANVSVVCKVGQPDMPVLIQKH